MEKPPVPDAVGIRALEGRRIEATSLSPFQDWKSFGANIPVGKPPVPDVLGIRAVEGRRTESFRSVALSGLEEFWRQYPGGFSTG